MYHAVNWDDIGAGPLATLLRYNNLSNREKLLLGAGTHCIRFTEYSPKVYPLNFEIVKEEHRLFDYWLKGIDNGIMNEPPIYYYSQAAIALDDWRFAWQWPVPNTKSVNLYLGSGPSGGGYGVNVRSKNSRFLAKTWPMIDEAFATGYLCVS